MDIEVALDGSKQRDLTMYAGDTQNLSVTVYASDGDTEPVEIANPRLLTDFTSAVSIPINSSFTVPDESRRVPYRLIAEIPTPAPLVNVEQMVLVNADGVVLLGAVPGRTATLAYGTISVHGGGRYGLSGTDYGWRLGG